MRTKNHPFGLAAVLLCASVCGLPAAHAQPAVTKPPAPVTATATLPTMPPAMGTATDQEVTKLKYELAKVKADLTAEIAKLRADLTAQAELHKTLVSTYEGHTHRTLAYSFDLVPTAVKCFKASDCDGMFYNREPSRASVIQASKPMDYTGEGGRF